jgi:hypothetical protein
MRSRSLFVALILTCFTVAAHSQVTPVASGLNNPRGLAFGPGGVLYVGEAGLGAGNGAGGVGLGVGFTGSVGEIRDLSSAHPKFRRILTGLASWATPEGVVGPDGVSSLGNGGLKVIIAESTSAAHAQFPDASPELLGQFGRLLRVSHRGTWKAFADVGDFDYTWAGENKNQDWAPAGQFPDANPYAVLSLPGHQYIADAGANTIDKVTEDGSVRIVAYVPNPLLPLGPSGTLVPVSDSVPTCVALGPDGFLYVGTLAFGANFATGTPTPESMVYRIDPHSTDIFIGDADVWASGFHPITGCGFSRGAFYVTEFVIGALGKSPGDVIRVELNPDGSPGARTTLAGGGALIAPNGFAAGPDGAVYVSNFSTFPGTNAGGPVGQVVRVDQ